MRLASNKLKDIVGFYNSELAGTYEKSEIGALANLAIEHYLGYSSTDVVRLADSNVNQSTLIKLYDCAKALKRQVPLQYILGEAWFYGLKFLVNKHVLIPRPETEELVDMVLKENKTAASFLDIGTGSGCIPIAIKKNLPSSNVSAADLSPGALQVARGNAALNQAEVLFFEADVLDVPAFEKKAILPCDVIISNPPYIMLSEKASMSDHVKGQEPDIALFVEGSDPIVFYKKIIDLCARGLNKKGHLYFELNPLTAQQVLEYANASGLFAQSALVKDMSGKTRFFKATRS